MLTPELLVLDEILSSEANHNRSELSTNIDGHPKYSFYYQSD